MLLGLLMLGVGGVGVGWGVVCSVREHRATRQKANPEWQVRAARQRVDDVLAGARTAMEEAAGIRRPGERRMSDSFGNWEGWL